MSKFSFKDKNITEIFDTHVRQQLPWYDLATDIVSHLVCSYTSDRDIVTEIGSSTGNIELALQEIIKDRNLKYQSFEYSKEMIDNYKGPTKPTLADVTKIELPKSNVVVCFLVLMFLKPKQQAEVFEKMMESLESDGVLIVFDKKIPDSSYYGIIENRLSTFFKMKRSNLEELKILQDDLNMTGLQYPLKDTLFSGRYYKDIFKMGNFFGRVVFKDSCSDN